MGGYNWLLPLNLGTDEAVYVEDSTFTLANGCSTASATCTTGQKWCFATTRSPTPTGRTTPPAPRARRQPRRRDLQQRLQRARPRVVPGHSHPLGHGRGVQQPSPWRTSRRCRWTTSGATARTLRRRSGRVTALVLGRERLGQSGWPCLDQIGRGSGTAYPNQPSVPLYVWNNGTDAGCNTGSACSNNRTMINDGDSHVQAGRDFINNGATPKPGYTPLAYPHPVRGGSSTAPAAPTGLRIVTAGPGW